MVQGVSRLVRGPLQMIAGMRGEGVKKMIKRMVQKDVNE